MVDDEKRLAALRARMVQLTAERERCRARATQYRQEAQSIARRLAAQPSASATSAQRTTKADWPKAELTYHEREFEVAGGAKQLLLRVFEPDLHGEKTLMIRVTGLDQDGGPEIRELALPQRLWLFVQRFCDAAQRISNEDDATSRTASPATTCRISGEAMPAQRSSSCSGTGATTSQHSSSVPRGESAAAASLPPRHQTSARRSATLQQGQGHPPQENVPQPTVNGTPANSAAGAKGRQRVPSRKQKASGGAAVPSQRQTSGSTGRRRGANGSVVISVRGGDVKISSAENL